MKPIFKNYDVIEVAKEIQNKLSEELKIYNDEINFDFEAYDDNIVLNLWYEKNDYVSSNQCKVINDVINAYALMYGEDNVWYLLETIEIENRANYRRHTPCWCIRVEKNK